VSGGQLNFAQEMVAGFQYGVGLVPGVEQTVNPSDIVDGTREVEQFRDLTGHCDNVAVFTLSPELFIDPLAAATSAGVPLVAVDNPLPDAPGVKLFVGNDNYKLGELLADQAIGRLPASISGAVVIGVNAPGVPVLERRAAGIRDRFKQKLPNVTVRGPFDTKQETNANHAAWGTLVAANPDAIAFLGTGDADGWNLAEIREKTNGSWVAGAFDVDPRSLAAVRKGDLVLVSPEHFVKGAVAGRLQAAAAKSGRKLPAGWIETPGLAVTPQNVDAIVARQASLAAKEAWFAKQVDAIVKSGPGSPYLRPLGEAS
jgi:ribose transport system substrate-binding protein